MLIAYVLYQIQLFWDKVQGVRRGKTEMHIKYMSILSIA